MANLRHFEGLEVWKDACALATKVYELTENNERLRRDFGLKDQIRRAAVSIASNIAEGFERSSKREFIYFLYTAKGSAGELRTQLHILREIGYISSAEFDALFTDVMSIAKQLGGFIAYLQNVKMEEEKGKRRREEGRCGRISP